MPEFDPDAYLAEKSSDSFDPDKYLADKSVKSERSITPEVKAGLEQLRQTPEGSLGYEESTTRPEVRAALEYLKPPPSEPAGSVFGKERFEHVPPQKGLPMQILGGLANVGADIGEPLTSPQNIALLPLAPVRGVGRLAGLLFGAQALADVPEAAKETIAPNKTAQERIESGGRTLTDILFGTAGVGYGSGADLALSRLRAKEAPTVASTELAPATVATNEALARLESQPKEVTANAEAIREDAGQVRGQVQARQPEIQGGPGESRTDLERGTPAQPSDAGTQEIVSSETPQPAAVSGPESPPAAVAEPSEARVISTAVKSGDEFYTGTRPGEGHEGISTRYELGDVPETDRGFWVKRADGTEGFATRDEAAQIAKESGQVPATHEGPLYSESLVEAPKGESTRPAFYEPVEPITVKPIVALRSIYEASEKAGQAGYERGLDEARTEGKAAVSQIKGELAIADKWMAGDQEKVRQNMVEYVNKTLPPDERGRFIGAITRALRRPSLQGGSPGAMYRNAFKVMQVIENRAEEVYKGGLVNEIKSTLTKSIDSPSIDVQYRRGVSNLLDQVSLTKPTEKTLSRLKSLNDFVERERTAGREPNIPKEELDQLSTLTKLPLRDMTVNSLEQLRNDVNNFVGQGRLKAQLMERAWNRERGQAITELQAAPSDPIESRPIYRPQPTEKLTSGQKFINGVRSTMNRAQDFEQAIAPMDEIYDHLDGARGTYDGWTSRNIKGKLDLAFNKKTSEWLPIKAESDALIKQHGLTKADHEAIGLKGIVTMIGRDRLEAMGVRPDILERIEKTPLTKGQQAYYDFTRRNYDIAGQRIQDIAHKLYQMDMEIVKDYVPLMRDWSIHAEKEAPAPLADPSAGEVPFNETATMQQLRRDVNPKFVSRTEQGFLKERLAGAKTAVKIDAAEVFERHMNDALHFIHSQPALKLLGEIVRTPDFATKYGKTAQNIVLDHLDTIANQGYVNHLQRIRWIDWIRNSTSKGAVGFRLASNIVHTSQLPIAAYHAGGPQWWSKGLELALTEKGQNWLRQNAAETYIRSGGEPAQAEVEMISKVGRAGFFIARNIDKLNSQATLLGRYVKEMQKRGVPVDDVLDAPVNPDVQALALRRMHRAVASPQAKDIPQMTSRGKSVGGNVSVARAINQFRNIFLDNWSNVRHDLLRIGTADADRVINLLRDGELSQGAKEAGDAASHRAAIAAAMLASVAMETGIKLYTKKGIRAGMTAITGAEPKKQKEEETYLGDLQHHLINRIPFAGQLTTMALYGDTGVPVIDAIVTPLRETGTALTSKKPETQAKHLLKAAGAAATVTGLPGASQLEEVVEPKATEQLAKALPDKSKPKSKGRDLIR